MLYTDSNDKYECSDIFENRFGDSMVLLRRKEPNAYNWLVVGNFKSYAFAKRQQAVDFCINHGYMHPTRGRGYANLYRRKNT